MVYQHVDEIDFELSALPVIPEPRRVVMVTPTHFEVEYVINPHMKGNLGSIDQQQARYQWDALQKAYTSISIEAEQIEGAAGFPDMVFCANQTLPYLEPHTGQRGVLLSNMFAVQRRGEVDYLASFFESEGYKTQHIENRADSFFEGMGDAIWHPGRYLLWGGYGYRTDVQVYDRISNYLDLGVIVLELTDPDFYHLDTCFSVLDEKSVLIYPDVFTEAGLALINRIFERVLEAPEAEARALFACNAHCPDRHHVIIQKGCNVTNAKLRAAGFEPVEVDTSEFLKSGGSVFCMKQMYW